MSDYKVTVDVDNEVWSFESIKGQTTGITKNDNSFLNKIVKSLENALEQVNGQLGIILRHQEHT